MTSRWTHSVSFSVSGGMAVDRPLSSSTHSSCMESDHQAMRGALEASNSSTSSYRSRGSSNNRPVCHACGMETETVSGSVHAGGSYRSRGMDRPFVWHCRECCSDSDVVLGKRSQDATAKVTSYRSKAKERHIQYSIPLDDDLTSSCDAQLHTDHYDDEMWTLKQEFNEIYEHKIVTQSGKHRRINSSHLWWKNSTWSFLLVKK